MSFVEKLESRTFLSASTTGKTFTVPWAKLENDPNVQFMTLTQMEVHEWTEDMSGAPESMPVWTDTVTGVHFTEPSLGNNGRLQISGSTNADQISVEKVTGLGTTSPLPAFVITSSPEEVITSVPAGSTGLTGLYTTPDGSEITSWGWNRDMIDNQAGLLPDPYGGFAPATQVLKEYKDYAGAGDDSDNLRVKDMTISGIQRFIDNYNASIAKWSNVSMTRVRVGNLYDVYVPDSVGVSTIAIDSGAGNDTISVAPNVTAKTSILGGRGNDMLISGKMHAYLAGGAGNDTLISRSKHGGTLEGGPGSDTLESRYGKMGIANPGATDYVAVHGQTYPMATAVSTLKVATGQTVFSQIFLMPDGLV